MSSPTLIQSQALFFQNFRLQSWRIRSKRVYFKMLCLTKGNFQLMLIIQYPPECLGLSIWTSAERIEEFYKLLQYQGNSSIHSHFQKLKSHRLHKIYCNLQCTYCKLIIFCHLIEESPTKQPHSWQKSNKSKNVKELNLTDLWHIDIWII